MRYRIPGRLAWYVDGGPGDEDGLRVYCLAGPDENARLLEDVAAVVWLAAADGDDAVEAVVAATGESAPSVAEQVVSFLGALVADGLLETVDGEGAHPVRMSPFPDQV